MPSIVLEKDECTTIIFPLFLKAFSSSLYLQLVALAVYSHHVYRLFELRLAEFDYREFTRCR